MENRVVIITGASRGIGHACAQQLDELGWSLALVARSEGDLKKSATSFKRAIVIPADVSDRDAPSKVVSRAIKDFGRVDALVNNAGYAPMLPVEKTTDEIWDGTIAVNLTATFRLTRECWPIFKKQKAGVVVNVSSVAGRDPFPGLIAYGAAKAGLINLGISLAREGAADNIRVHTIAPAATETKMFRSLPGVEHFGADMTMSPADVARTIVLCATGQLAHTSGETIYLRK